MQRGLRHMDCRLVIPPYLDNSSVFGINNNPTWGKADRNSIGSHKTPIRLADNLAAFHQGRVIPSGRTRWIVVNEAIEVNRTGICEILMR